MKINLSLASFAAFVFKSSVLLLGLSLSLQVAKAQETQPDSASNVEATINFPLNISLSPKSGTLGVGTTQTLTATVTKQSDNTAVSGASVSFSPSDSLSPTSQTTDANGTATSTFTTPTKAGTSTVTASVSWEADASKNVSAGTASDQATFSIIGGDPIVNGDSKVHYYNNLGDPSPSTSSAIAQPQPSGTTWTWATSSSMIAKPVTFGTYTKAELYGVAATPISQGVGSEWVQITYTLNGVSVSSKKIFGWTVVQPSSLQQLSLTDSVFIDSNFQIYLNGFVSEYRYQVKDQFGSNMTYINVNEDFGTFFTDYPGQNWPNGTPNGKYTADGQFVDDLGAHVEAPGTPLTSAPQSPLGTTKVYHFAHVYRGGSLTPGRGTAMGIFTTQIYTDHGRNQ